jgi:dUTP pyrophosphatase
MKCKGFEDNPDVIMPVRKTAFSAGYDFSCLTAWDIKPGETVLIPTGLKAQMEKGDVLLIYPRSSLAVKKGLRLANSVAVIDADYFSNPSNDGHIMIPVYNFSKNSVHLDKGERIAQGIFTKYLTVDDDQAAGQRTGGYGSTGEK